MTPPHVEPPEELRDRDGWHWLETQVPADPPYIAQLPWFWAATNQTWRYGETMKRTPDELAQVGWRYASPCLTPTEVAALRAERDAAVALVKSAIPAIDVASEIKLIMQEYERQEAAGSVDTPGGLEHMGDVWKTLSRWYDRLRAASPKLKP